MSGTLWVRNFTVVGDSVVDDVLTDPYSTAVLGDGKKKQKQQQSLLDALKKGDKVVTTSGIWGTIINIGKETVTLQIADNTKIKMQRDNVSRVRGEEEDKDKEKDKDKDA